MPLFGVGLRPTHFPYLENTPIIESNFFEAISENYMNTQGRPLEMLLKVRESYPVALHGVAMSIGSQHGVSPDYLLKLKALAERIDPLFISDHLCWSQATTGSTHDLLPLPLTTESLKQVKENVDQAQTFLGRPILLENISYYLKFKDSDLEEATFINDICSSTGCGLLLDLNNVFVNSVNHKFDPVSFLDEINLKNVKQMHLAGPSQEDGYLFDTHSTRVPDQVWVLYETVLNRGLNVPTLIEWDEDIPDYLTLESEVKTAKDKYKSTRTHFETRL